MSDNSFKTGDKVSHEIFGEGIVLKTEGKEDLERVQVHFNSGYTTWFVVSYGKLTKIETQEPINKKPHLTLVRANMENTNTGDMRIKTENFTQNVEKIENQSVQVIEKQVNNYKKNSKPKQEPLPRLLPEQGGLTDGHRATLDKLISKYAMLLAIIKPWNKESPHIIAKRSACEAAKSSGKDGCGKIVRMLDTDFECVEKSLNGKIAGCYQNELVKKKRTDKLNEAHKRLKELGVSDDKRREYQFIKHNHYSMADFDINQLHEYCEYLKQPNPTFDPYEGYQDSGQDTPKQTAIKLKTQEKRELILKQWLAKKEIEDSSFDRRLIPYSTEDFYIILRALDKLFSVSGDTLRKFMEKQKICTLKTGSKPK